MQRDSLKNTIPLSVIMDGLDTGFERIRQTIDTLIAKVPASQSAGAYEVAAWVFNNAKNDWPDIDAANVPSRGAIRLLEWVTKCDTNYSNFVRSIWSKTIPTKSTIESESNRHTDDGRQQVEMLEGFAADLLEQLDDSSP